MPLHVSILKDARLGDCTNGGVTSNANAAFLLGENDPLPEAEVLERIKASGRVVLKVVRRNRSTVIAVPLDKPEGHLGPMFGGNFVYSSDSRFRRICEYPIYVHDRFETPELYRALSI